jgi:hypothetical protein
MAGILELVIDASTPVEDIQAYQDAIEVALYARTQQLTHMFAERVRANLSGEVLQSRSGRLLGTVMEQGPYATGDSIQSGVIAGGEEAPYGIVHEKGGIDFYTIYPVNRKALAFEMNGKMCFFASVNHPPALERPWFGPVADEMMALWGDELQAAIGEVQL